MILAAADSEFTMRNVFNLTAPEAILLAAACIIYLGGTIWANRRLWAAAALGSLVLAGIVFWNRVPPHNLNYLISPLRPDSLADLIRVVAYIGGIVLTLLFWDEVADRRAADFHACVLILIAGLSLVAAANDLITIFVSLELISIPTYVLLYLPRSGLAAQEAAVKYFLLSIFASALLLFGFSYLYGMEGTTNLAEFFSKQEKRGETASSLLLVALVTMVAGLGFRITAVPFHFYAPDVFQGAPTSVAAMLAFVPKVAGFAALVRILGLAGDAQAGLVADSQLALLFWLLAAITMTTGNVLALLQNNLKRLLAYSSIAHGGYMLIGLAAAPHLRSTSPQPDGTLGLHGLNGIDALFFYLIAYGAMTVGAFAVILYLRSPQREAETVDDLAGLGRTHPLLALALSLFLFSLIGLPLTGGFSGKLLLFFSAIGAEGHVSGQHKGLFIALAVIGALNSAIGAYFYLRIIATMYLRDALRPFVARLSVPTVAAIVFCAVVTLSLGIYPLPVVHLVRAAVAGDGVFHRP